ncbi:MAG: condensation domain-containing protein, partial [Acutalibacteraceae bacterium]|nr:condensation domain-containing protein [Acutalibacteraceae bacterium]
YYTSDSEINMSDIRETLAENLPEYMIPSYMMQIEKIPVTTNGKLDKKALPEAEAKPAREYVAPVNDVQEMLCGLFESVLKVENIGIEDDFIELGGDSIKVIRLISLLRDKGYSASVKDIMQRRTVASIEKILKSDKSELSYEQGEVVGVIKNTPMINEFVKWNLAKPEHFNQTYLIGVGAVSDEIIKKAVESIVIHHDILRAVYTDNTLKVQSVEESKLFDFYSINLTETSYTVDMLNDKCNEIQQSMNLENGPLVKVLSVENNGQKFVVFIVHHLLVDGVSWRIIQEDMETAIAQQLNGEEIVLPPKTVSFIEWSNAIYEYAESDEFADVSRYWNKEIPKLSENNFALPADSSVNNAKSEPIALEFSSEETQQIKDSGSAYNTGIKEILLSALAITVNKMSQQENVTVFIEGHGREKIHKEILTDRTVGWFTNLYPLVLVSKADFGETIIENKEIIRNVPNNGFGYMLMNNRPSNSKDYILFNYLGEFEGDDSSDKSKENYTLGMDVAEENSAVINNDISFNGLVSGDILTFNIAYNAEKYSVDTIKEFVEEFRSSLLRLADYCNGYEDTMFTASDFSDDLDSDEFDSILDLL